MNKNLANVTNIVTKEDYQKLSRESKAASINVASNVLSYRNNAKNLTVPKYEWIDISKLKFADYQREPQYKDYKKIADNFDYDLFGNILVSNRDGEYWLLDGGHRTKAAHKNGLTSVMCQVLDGLTYQMEADKFLKFNIDRKRLNANQIFAAKVARGDVDMIDIKNIIGEYGFSYTINNTTKSNNTIAAMSCIQDIYNKIHAKGLRRLLNIIREAWMGDKSALSARLLSGLKTFLYMYGDEVDDVQFIKAIKKYQPEVIEGQAIRYVDTMASIGGGKNTYECVAKIFFEIYNKASKSKLDYNKFSNAG